MKKKATLLILLGLGSDEKHKYVQEKMSDVHQWHTIFYEDVARKTNKNSGQNKEDKKIQSIIFHGSIYALLSHNKNVIADTESFETAELEQWIEKYNTLATIQFHVIEPNGNINNKNYATASLEKFYHLKSQFDFSTRSFIRRKNICRLQNEQLPKAVICDLDGTLALINDRSPFDASKCEQDLPNVPVVNMIIHYHQLGYKILLLSGRPNIYIQQTIQWLESNRINYDYLWMREADDMRKDAIIKKEIFEREIENKFYIEVVLDDRDQVVRLWRDDLQLPCFQVFYGDF